MRPSYAFFAAGGLLAAIASNLSESQSSETRSSTEKESFMRQSDGSATATLPKDAPSVSNSGLSHSPDALPSPVESHFDILTISPSMEHHQEKIDPPPALSALQNMSLDIAKLLEHNRNDQGNPNENNVVSNYQIHS